MRREVEWSRVCRQIHSDSSAAGPQGRRARGGHDVPTASSPACTAVRRLSVGQRDVPRHRNVSYFTTGFQLSTADWLNFFNTNVGLDKPRSAKGSDYISCKVKQLKYISNSQMQFKHHHLHTPPIPLYLAPIKPVNPGSPGKWPLKRREKSV